MEKDSKEIIDEIFRELREEFSFEEEEREKYISSLSSRIRRGGRIGGHKLWPPGGDDGDFPFSIQKRERGFSMNQEMTRSLRGLGNALIKSYFHDWLPEKKRIDRYLENVVLNSPILRMDKVQGGDHITPQERLLQLKEENEGYQALSRNIERMEAFLDSLNDDERALVELYYCQGLGLGEISFKLKKDQADVLKNLSSIQKRLGGFWTGESVENVYSGNS